MYDLDTNKYFVSRDVQILKMYFHFLRNLKTTIKNNLMQTFDNLLLVTMMMHITLLRIQFSRRVYRLVQIQEI